MEAETLTHSEPVLGAERNDKSDRNRNSLQQNGPKSKRAKKKIFSENQNNCYFEEDDFDDDYVDEEYADYFNEDHDIDVDADEAMKEAADLQTNRVRRRSGDRSRESSVSHGIQGLNYGEDPSDSFSGSDYTVARKRRNNIETCNSAVHTGLISVSNSTVKIRKNVTPVKVPNPSAPSHITEPVVMVKPKTKSQLSVRQRLMKIVRR